MPDTTVVTKENNQEAKQRRDRGVCHNGTGLKYSWTQKM